MNENVKPIELLVEEHTVILLALQGLLGLAAQAEAADGADSMDVTVASKAIEFIVEFADRHHHGKEEKLLFNLMEQRGFARTSGPLAVMYHEHETGRALVRSMATSLDKIASKTDYEAELAKFADNARQFAQLLSAHIQKENQILYPMAQKYLTSDDMGELEKMFSAFETEAAKTGVQETYYELGNRLGSLAPACGSGDESGCEGCGSYCG
ncbi:MAG: hypothetical protein A2X94_03490 [Bdellovibrionales bacterium GWB1_55_8]|nr:MAG: hypothetical protein A2X94_03490 [Bdellovibrionales bacterium GWB1_55_8]